MAIPIAVESPSIDVTAAQRQVGALEQQTIEQFQGIRTVAGTTDAAFSFGPRASRPASGAQGDRYYADDFGARGGVQYVYTGTAWEVEVGFVSGTDAQRSAYTPDTTDNGLFYWTTDTCKLWEVSGGGWADRFVSLDATTSYEVAGTKVVGARDTGWTAGTGTPNKGAFATYAGQDVGAAYVEAEVQAIDDAVKANSQRIKALEDMLRTHGLMN